MRRFWITAFGAAAALAAVTTSVALNPATNTSDVVRDIGQAISALAASATCAWLTRHSTGRVRWAWGSLALSGATVTVAELVEAGYTVWSGATPSLLSVSDVGIALAIPTAIAGLLFLPPEHDQYATRRRALLDAAMIALSLIYVGSALSLPQLFIRFTSPAASWIGLTSLALDFSLLTVVSLTVRRGQDRMRPRILFVLAGLALTAVSNCASVFLAATGDLTALRELLSSGSMYGFAMVAVAPHWPERTEGQAEDAMPLWPDLIPYIGVGAVAIAAVAISMAHQPMTGYAAAAAGGLAVILLASHLLSRSEARHLLRQTKRDQAKLKEREVMLNNVIDHAPQGVASITVERRITNANPRLASMLDAPLQVLLGGLTDAFLPQDYVARVFKSFAPTSDGSTDVYESDCQARRADSSQFWVHWSVTPIRKADGAIDYFMATFEDVTAKREADELSAANLAQLEKLNRLKSEFVSMVSHEFRTALVGIQGFSELIRDQEMEVSEIKALAEEIYNDSQRLNRMITEMLDFDRLEAGKLRLELRPLDINQLVRESVEHAAVSTHKHNIATELASDLPDVVGDADRLTQVMMNLLSNAVKYSPNSGDICVATRLNGGMVEVAVRDHGRGIPHEFVSRLFGKYERYEDNHAGKIIGTGLGLAITRQIVEMHGGRITVESVVGQGSEFRFSVPVTATKSAFTKSA